MFVAQCAKSLKRHYELPESARRYVNLRPHEVDGSNAVLEVVAVAVDLILDVSWFSKSSQTNLFARKVDMTLLVFMIFIVYGRMNVKIRYPD